LLQSSEEAKVKNQYSPKSRNKLRVKMATVFGAELRMLSTEMQQILLDDLVTAFENRLKVFQRTQSDFEFEMAESVVCETL
jgi:hypothetical protein